MAALTAGTPSLGGLGPSRAAGCGPSPRPSPGTSLQPHSSAWSQGQACAEHLEPNLCRGSRGRAETPSARRAPARASLSPAPSPPSGVQWSWSKGVSGPKGGPAPAPVGRTCSHPAVAVPCPHFLPSALPRLVWAPGMSTGARPASPRPPPLGPRGLGAVRAGQDTSVCQAPSGCLCLLLLSLNGRPLPPPNLPGWKKGPGVGGLVGELAGNQGMEP